MRKLYLLGLLCFLHCEDPIDIDLPGNPNLVVIEGWITDKPGPQVISITRTNGFSSKESNPKIDDASVRVFDQNGGDFIYTNIGNGIYVSESGFTGSYNELYDLRVILSNGDTIISSSEMLMEVSDIDSLGYDSFITQDEENPRLEIEVYYPIAIIKDPMDEVNFYKWKIFRNDTLFSDPAAIILQEDRFVNGNVLPNQFTDFDFSEFDTIGVEVQSISQQTYDYFRLFKSQVISLGTSSGSAPASLTGNLRNISNPGEKVLGFFAATSIKSGEQVIIP